jgi:hypothetical protein
MGMPMFAARGFGLGGYMVMDAQAHSLTGAGEVGAYGWPGAYGGFWQADPARHDWPGRLPEGGLPSTGLDTDPSVRSLQR